MSEQSAIDNAVKRLAMALDALDAAVERRREVDRNEDTLAAQVQTLGLDRARLASVLDGETARARKLEATNREIAERLDTAIASIQSVLEGSEFWRHGKRQCDDCRPPVPPRLRGRTGGAFAGARRQYRRAYYRVAQSLR